METCYKRSARNQANRNDAFFYINHFSNIVESEIPFFLTIFIWCETNKYNYIFDRLGKAPSAIFMLDQIPNVTDKILVTIHKKEKEKRKN